MKWNELPKLPSRRFTYENSGRKEGDAPPMWIDRETGELKSWFSAHTPIGWTDNPPFGPDYSCIAIMFEDQEFNEIWWHYNDPREESKNRSPEVAKKRDDGF